MNDMMFHKGVIGTVKGVFLLTSAAAWVPGLSCWLGDV